ncbi:MAG TPA: hypothetical protein VL946_06380, partial [Lacibacter sp.]|nr:hypothetical protein [Lacibacter sp.]
VKHIVRACCHLLSKLGLRTQRLERNNYSHRFLYLLTGCKEKDFLGERENKLLAETLMNDSMCRLFGSKKIIFVKSDSHEFPNE